MHGLVPGASMFTEKAPVTYTIIFGYLLSNILMGLIGLAIAKYVARVSTVPMGVLGPLVVALSAIGTYAIRNNMFDVFVMLAFGLLGYLLRRTGFATAPLVLGMVLGEIVESNWRRALIMSRGNMFKYFLSRPISLALLVLIALSMFTPVLMNYVDKKSRAQEKSA